MKKTILSVFIALAFISCKAQVLEQPTVPIENLKGLSVEGTYYKDVHNLLNPFVGTWMYSNGTSSLKFVLKKIVGFEGIGIKEDILVGEYEYVENGVTKINTLPNINVEIPNKINHDISGNTFAYWFIPPACNECAPNELRLQLILGDPLKEVAYSMLARKIIFNGQDALQIYMYSDGIKYSGDTLDNYQTESVGATMPNGTFIFIKQP
jgi:hypothetical protein